MSLAARKDWDIYKNLKIDVDPPYNTLDVKLRRMGHYQEKVRKELELYTKR